jgi:peptide/nickel transport system permease protein
MLGQKITMVSIAFILVLVVLSLAGSLVARFDPNTLSAGGAGPLETPSVRNWLGTDALGRDTASRLIAGTRLVLRDSVIVTSLTILIAVPIGLIAGYFQGWRDGLLMRALDATYSIPPIVLVLAIAQVTNQNLPWLLLGIAVAFVPTLSRLVRSQTLQLREELFIEASRGIGTPTSRILLRRVLPNTIPPVVVQSTIIMSQTIFMQATLAILAVGYPVGSAAWGSMLNDAYETIYADPWAIAYPGLAIALTVLAFNAIGDGLRDALGLGSHHGYGRKVKLGLTEAVSRTRSSTRAITAGAPATPTQTEASEHAEGPPLLDVRNLTVDLKRSSGFTTAVADVSFQVQRGEAVGLVGESGSGKTLTSLSIMRLLQSPPFRVGGEVRLNGVDLQELSLPQMRRVRGREISMIFQDPMSALNPAQTVGKQIAESILLHDDVSRRVAGQRAIEMLAKVGIPDPRRRADAYPHEFSGGMRQRAMIGIALASSPKLLIADEPTTALDVTVQAQILELLKSLQDELELAIVFVTHDLGIVAEFCDRAVVMYAGQIIEMGPTRTLFEASAHPYTEALLAARSGLDERGGTFAGIRGQVPQLGEMPPGCRFEPRCSYATQECASGLIGLDQLNDASVRCIRPLVPKGAVR